MSAHNRRPVNWKHWRIRAIAEDWETTALSLGIDPRSMDHDRPWGDSVPYCFTDDSFRSTEEKIAFDERFRLVDTFHRFQKKADSRLNAGEVLLAAFAAWCVESGLRVPPEFAALANAADTPAEPAALAGASPDDEPISALERGVTRNVIIGAFPVKSDRDDNVKFWDDKLAEPPLWLKSARTFSGDKGVTSLWNPLKVAHALLGWRANYMSVRALDKVMRERFPAQFDAWKEGTPDVKR